MANSNFDESLGYAPVGDESAVESSGALSTLNNATGDNMDLQSYTAGVQSYLNDPNFTGIYQDQGTSNNGDASTPTYDTTLFPDGSSIGIQTGTSNVTADNNTSTSSVGSGYPVYVTGDAGDTQVAQAITAAENTAQNTAVGVTNAATATGAKWFDQLVIIILGMIFVAVGLGMFKGGSKTVVQNLSVAKTVKGHIGTAKSAAKVAAAVAA